MHMALDYETFFDTRTKYSLKNMTTEAYLRDPRFEVHGAAVAFEREDPVWVPARDLRNLFRTLDWDKIVLTCHHAQFDGAILAWHYGCVPKVYVCTLSMARAVIGPHMKASLDALAKHFALAPKSVPYKDFDGLHWGELNSEIQTAVAEGSCHDLNLTRRISDFLLHGPYPFPPGELLVIDTTVRMFTRPALVGDVAALAEIWQHEEDTKAARFAALDVDPKVLNSQEGFAALLRVEGVEPAVKTGKNGRTIYATAKTDSFMQDLLESDNERVALLAAARLGIRSTIDQTRSERLGFMARRGALPVYLSYAAALTRRWGGGDKCLTADTRVVVFDPQNSLVMEKRIVDVLRDDLVWDGEEFVEHEGVVFQGYAEVIEHDGVKGTADHNVFTQAGPLTLGEARDHDLEILPCPRPPTLPD